MPQLLHNHKEFNELISIVASNLSIAPALVEKDYWIMHCLYGLQKMNLTFELKGGTSLSKGFGIIERFSEDIDIRIGQALYHKTQPQFDSIIDRIQTAFALGL
jgi:predicted nucleotidyltransferase component of viral defense system